MWRRRRRHTTFVHHHHGAAAAAAATIVAATIVAAGGFSLLFLRWLVQVLFLVPSMMALVGVVTGMEGIQVAQGRREHHFDGLVPLGRRSVGFESSCGKCWVVVSFNSVARLLVERTGVQGIVTGRRRRFRLVNRRQGEAPDTVAAAVAKAAVAATAVAVVKRSSGLSKEPSLGGGGVGGSSAATTATAATARRRRCCCPRGCEDKRWAAHPNKTARATGKREQRTAEVARKPHEKR